MAKLVGKRTQKSKAEIKIFLKAKGHKVADVDTEVDGRTVSLALMRLHGVTVAEYRIGGGRS